MIGQRLVGAKHLDTRFMVEAMRSGRFVVWPADPSGRHGP